MILVTVGSMLPFDRLIQTVDELAHNWPRETFVAQIGGGTYAPKNMSYSQMLSAPDFRAMVLSSRLIVAHAGMGSVITAMEIVRPLVLLPRRVEFGEHTTDHQLATARWLKDKQGIFVAMESVDLLGAIETALLQPPSQVAVASTAPASFLAKIREAISVV